jgi:hypothetical protein
MKTTELNNRLRNLETLTFTNETDVFEFSFSNYTLKHHNDLKGGFRIKRNGSFLNRPNLTLGSIVIMIQLLKLEIKLEKQQNI